MEVPPQWTRPGALSGAGIDVDALGTSVKVSHGDDNRVWVRPDGAHGDSVAASTTLAEAVVTALAGAGLQLESTMEADALGPAEKLVQGNGCTSRAFGDDVSCGPPPWQRSAQFTRRCRRWAAVPLDTTMSLAAE